MTFPIDYLRSVNNSRFQGRNFFYITFGDTLILDKNKIGQGALSLYGNNIHEITFILSEVNFILLDTLTDQLVFQVIGSGNPFGHIVVCRNPAQNSWISYVLHASVLAHHMDKEKNGSKERGQGLMGIPPSIKGKLFSKDNKTLEP